MTSTSEQEELSCLWERMRREERRKSQRVGPIVRPSGEPFTFKLRPRRRGEWRHTQCGLGTADTFTFNLSSLTATGRSVPRTQNVQSAMPNVNPQFSPLYANGNRLQLSLWALGTNCVSPKKLSVCLQSFAARLLSRVCKARYHHRDLPC